LPLFRGKERARSIRDIPEWERVMALLGERTGEEYEVAPSQLPLGIFGRSEFEILRDKKHHTVVYPSSLNQMVKFNRFVPEKVSLTKLDVGFAPDGTGTQLAGIWTSFVSRRFVDGFVACMKDVYSASWGNMHAWAMRGGALPIFLLSDIVSMSIAPYALGDQSLRPTGKYQPQAGADSNS